MTMDRITEEISHFIGFFHMIVEDSPVHQSYTDFSCLVPKDHVPKHPVWHTEFNAPFELLGFEPDIRYKAPSTPTQGIDPNFVLGSRLHQEPRFQHGERSLPDVNEADPIAATRTGRVEKIFAIEPPGSIANYVLQAASLADNDDFNVGGSGLEFVPDVDSNAELLQAAEEVLSASVIGDYGIPGSSTALIDVILSMTSELKPIVAASVETDNAIVYQAETIKGIYVDGSLVDEAPKLEDFHRFETPGALKEMENGDRDDISVSKNGSITIHDAVEVETGSNTLLNNAVVQNVWTGARVTAVVGDHIEINAVSQVNAIWSTDTITDAVKAWTDESQPDVIHSIATFERTDPAGHDAVTQLAKGGFPSNWAVAEINGDLLITNWLQQYIFMSDNDIGILSSSGVTTHVMAGGNVSTNQLSILELGYSYDLIIVGGSVYDANIIQQTNILFDNDVVGAVSGFATTGNGKIAASGNLLWNEAYIQNIGAADRFGDLPSAYLDTANKMADGNMSLSSGVLLDPAFAGLSGLRVLYISGDLVNTQYIRQVNILGDNDQIALAMHAISPKAGADWSVATGGNALINNAAILDLDSIGKTYVGGGQYSQETLFQAGLVNDQPELAARDPDALVNEAVAFLDDSMLDLKTHDEAAPVSSQHDHLDHSDGLHHMLG